MTRDLLDDLVEALSDLVDAEADAREAGVPPDEHACPRVCRPCEAWRRLRAARAEYRRAFEAAWRAPRAPGALDEALNSGDGSYRP